MTKWTIKETPNDYDFSGEIQSEHGDSIAAVYSKSHLAPISKLPELIDMLKECILQIEYLHEKFQETGTGNTVLSRAKAMVDSIKTD